MKRTVIKYVLGTEVITNKLTHLALILHEVERESYHGRMYAK